MMMQDDGALLLSASDLMRFQGCAHATALDLAFLRGVPVRGAPLQPAEATAEAALLQARGNAHEQDHLADLQAQPGRQVVTIERGGRALAAVAAQTRAVLAEGPETVFQAAFHAPPWGGFADFLERVEMPSALGGHAYEVVDTKLKRRPAPAHVLQLVLYSDLLAAVQGVVPRRMHLVLGNGHRVSLELADFTAHARHARDRLSAFLAELDGQLSPESGLPSRPEPVAACGLCRWRQHCAAQWEAEDALCLVAGITRGQRRKLEAAGVHDLAALARRKAAVPGMAAETLEKLHRQARLQHARRRGGAPAFELRPLAEGRGLARLPRPDPGDLFFDMEGDPHADEGDGGHGLEYLFGFHWQERGQPRYRAFWAHDRAAEGQAADEVPAFMTAHLRKYPKAHVYHYNHYEVTALKRLTDFHGRGAQALDELLRGQRFVDLYRVVQQGLVSSEPGYSIKDMEAFYRGRREGPVATGMDSVVAYEAWRADGDPERLESIRAYNEEDCVSTRELRDWLLAQVRPHGLPWFEGKGAAAEVPVAEKPERAEARAALAAVLAKARDRLGASAVTIGAGEAMPLADLLLHLAQFHERESKPAWRSIFEAQGAESADLVEDLDCLGGLVADGKPEPVKHSMRRRYRFPAQDSKLRAGSGAMLRQDLAAVTIEELDLRRRRAVLRFGPKIAGAPEQLDLLPASPPRWEVLEKAVYRVAMALAAKPTAGAAAAGQPYPALHDLLTGQPPRLKATGRKKARPASAAPAAAPILAAGMDVVAGSVAAVQALDGGTLPIQGPPGTGKTHTAACAILALLREGRRVAVCATAHKAIDNLLAAVAARAAEAGFPLHAVKKGSAGDTPPHPDIAMAFRNEDRALAQASLVGGTAWLFARPEQDRAFDTLVVDEAGQVSLATLLAMGACARNIVLVGDPMQLPQPLQAAHPPGTGLSALDIVLQGGSGSAASTTGASATTLAPERGIFLPVSRRLHPDLCRLVSAIAYGGRLESHPDTARHAILPAGTGKAARGTVRTGLRFTPVEHAGNSQSSAEEVAAVVAAHADLLAARFRDRDGRVRPMTLDDILVVAPYNAQVNALAAALPAGARVGTVDRFQGQEAPACLISLATSSADDLPRDIGFLLSLNRLNVALSRAQALAILFASPRLLDMPCNSLDDMRRVNALCLLAAEGGAATC